ncbi:MAG: UDP-N-acetyl glucosamine 2-epimerase [Candidatus Atribacteria bacterium]|nr:UDP-N-acetyl glucosamine 2-epimerase [Candidatus Atribacteria bacterium]
MKTNKLKILTILGTRPEIIRLSRVMARLDEYTNHILVHTGQNYDYELNEIFFKDLEIRKPDYFLNVDTSSLGAAVGDIIRKSEEVLKKEKPDAVLVLGDTNSCLAAYMAKRLHIPIFHMEAGNRCFDFNVPEEINRRIIDHIADFNLVYTEHARRHLLSEGLPHRRIYLTGSPMKEVLDYYRPKIDTSTILKDINLAENCPPLAGAGGGLIPGKYFIVSVHREENVDNPENLKNILAILESLVEKYNYPVIVSTHPRTLKRIEELNSSQQSAKSEQCPPLAGAGGGQPGSQQHMIQFLKPFGFTDYVALQMHAACTISDSGTISEESAILSFPAISLRNSMERPEAQDAGTIILTGFNKDVVLNSIETAIAEHRSRKYNNNVADYSINDTSWRVLKLIQGLAGLSNRWHGIT